ncbi:VCBS repeat-containing protein [bacterium]|nr:VCBS repeat-containing protein [bacterium]
MTELGNGRGGWTGGGLCRALLLAALASLACACNVQESADAVAREILRGTSPSKAELQAENPPEDDQFDNILNSPFMGNSVSQQQLDELWASYSEEDQERLLKAGWNMDALRNQGQYSTIDNLRGQLDGQLEYSADIEFHPAGAVKGRELIWRRLADYSNGGNWCHMKIGNLDGDADEEVLMGTDPYVVHEVDGSSRELGGMDWQQWDTRALWDYDGDGIDELIAVPRVEKKGAYMEEPLPDETQVFSMAGELLATLPCQMPYSLDVTGDFDGDGHKELLLDGPLNQSFNFDRPTIAFSTGGSELWRVAGNSATTDLMPGDVDGDGITDLLGHRYITQSSPGGGSSSSPGPLQAFSIGKPPVDVQLSAEAGRTAYIDYCADLDGDGKVELLYGRRIFDITDGSSVELEQPAGWDDMELGKLDGPTFVVIERGGEILLAARAVEHTRGWKTDALLMWNSKGKLVLEQYMGELLYQLGVVHAGGRQYLVVFTENSLMIAP